MIDSTTITPEQQEATARYRAAIETLVVMVTQMDDAVTADAGTILSELTNDLADGQIDGTVDGSSSTVYIDETLDILQQDPATLLIPGTTTPISEIGTVLASETTDTGATADTTQLETGGSISIVEDLAPAETDPDLDNDGVLKC